MPTARVYKTKPRGERLQHTHSLFKILPFEIMITGTKKRIIIQKLLLSVCRIITLCVDIVRSAHLSKTINMKIYQTSCFAT